MLERRSRKKENHRTIID